MRVAGSKCLTTGVMIAPTASRSRLEASSPPTAVKSSTGPRCMRRPNSATARERSSGFRLEDLGHLPRNTRAVGHGVPEQRHSPHGRGAPAANGQRPVMSTDNSLCANPGPTCWINPLRVYSSCSGHAGPWAATTSKLRRIWQVGCGSLREFQIQGEILRCSYAPRLST